jgi:aryl-alcohol dehydrogenase-like predicted oxidoreductase
MESRKLGKNGPEVSAIGLGCMGMSGIYGQSDEKESIATLERALELGSTFLDTADFYGVGHNEELISRVIKGKRDKAFLSVKFGVYRSPAKNGSIGWGPINTHPDYIRNAIAYSLQRLKTDYIDLYTPARVDPSVPIEETIGAMADLVRDGFIRYIGLSEASAVTIKKAVKVHPVAALQIEYSLWSRDIENEVLPAIREAGVGLVAYSPLSRGFLSGELKSPENIKDSRAFMPRFHNENFYKNLELVEKVKGLALKKGCTPSQLAIAWVLAQGKDIITIPGTKHIKYLEQNIEAGSITLSPEDLKTIDEIVAPGLVAGERYGETQLKHLNG